MPPMVDDGKLGITKCGRREKLIFMEGTATIDTKV
jgi:hypothetical protein